MSTSPPTQPGEPRRPPPRADETQPRLRPEPIPPAIQVGGSVGGDVAGRDLNKTTTAGRDVVGGDVVTTTNVGFSIEAVQRLVITVGVLVFATVLERFFALYASLNSFTRMIAVTQQREEPLYQWPPRAGEQILL